MRRSNANVEACASLVQVGQIVSAIDILFNETCAEEIVVVHYAVINELISRNAEPGMVTAYRDMVRGCAYDCGLKDPNVQSHWTDEDHVRINANEETFHVVRATRSCSVAAGSGNTRPAIGESASAPRIW